MEISVQIQENWKNTTKWKFWKKPFDAHPWIFYYLSINQYNEQSIKHLNQIWKAV